MLTLNDGMKNLNRRLAGSHRYKQYSPEEIEAARRAVSAKNAACQPDCPICGGSGYVRSNAQPGEPGFGKLQTCPNMYQINIVKGSTRYGLTPDEVENLSWGAMEEVNDGPVAAALIKEVLALQYGLVYLWGSHGQGKTLALKIATAVSVRAGLEAAYVNMADLLSDLREAYDLANPNIEAARRLDRWIALPCLAIDEFNRVSDTPYVKEKRFTLLDARNTGAIRQQSITLIASNTGPDAQESYLASRFKDGRFHVLALNADDARPLMSAGNLY